MAKQINLDGIEMGGIRLMEINGQMQVEAHYRVLSGKRPILVESKDITELLAPQQRADLVALYQAILGRIQQVELS